MLPFAYSNCWRQWIHSKPDRFRFCGGEGGNSKSQAPKRAYSRWGASPLAPPLCSGHPMKGAHPLQHPPFESHPQKSRPCSTCTFLNLDETLTIGGEGGIRTHGPFQVNGFRDRPIRPLSHLSAGVVTGWKVETPEWTGDSLTLGPSHRPRHGADEQRSESTPSQN